MAQRRIKFIKELMDIVILIKYKTEFKTGWSSRIRTSISCY